jgi:hypothetical protein
MADLYFVNKLFTYGLYNISLRDLHNLNKLGWTGCEIGWIGHLVIKNNEVLCVVIM